MLFRVVNVCVCVDEEFQGEDELDKELLWNLQLLSEVRRGSITFQEFQHPEMCESCSFISSISCFEMLFNLKTMEESSGGIIIFH